MVEEPQGLHSLPRLPAEAVALPPYLPLAEGPETCGPLDVPEGRWWVLHTRARNEKAVAEALASNQIRHYLPLVRSRHTRNRRVEDAARIPLFPGYLFLCGEHGACEFAKKTNRVANILPVADQERLVGELRQIERVLASGTEVDLYPALRVGRRCRIVRGSLKGIEGVVVRRGGASRMFLAATFIGQSAVIELEASALEAVD